MNGNPAVVIRGMIYIGAINGTATTRKQWNNHSVSIVIILISGDDTEQKYP
jgi:hypothetical protein